MKRIAFILGSMGRGGAERVISILSRSYAERGYQTDIIVLLSGEVGYKLHETTRVLDFSGKRQSRMKRLPYWFKSIRGYYKEYKPDVVVSFAARINVIVKMALIGLKANLIVSERNDPRHDGRSRFVDMMTKRIYPKVAAVVFQTERAKSYFPKLNNSRIIPNPIVCSCLAENENPSKVVSVGRLTAQKNQKMLINAFSKVVEENPEAFLEIYGSGEMEGELKRQIKELNLIEKVFLRGNVDDVHFRIKDSAVFCLSSDYEGLSNALLEALAMGIPCVSTNCAGADEYITNGENGFIVSTGDEEGIAKSISTLLNDASMRKAFSERGMNESVNFLLPNVIEKWDSLILREGESNEQGFKNAYEADSR